MGTHYNILGVAPDCEAEVLQAAFRAMSRKYHPDRNPDGQPKMIAVNAAYEILSDPAKRSAYDRLLAAQSAELPRAPARPSATVNEPTDADFDLWCKANSPRQFAVDDDWTQAFWWWVLVPAVSAWGIRSNFGAEWTLSGLTCSLAALFTYVLWRPTTSVFKMKMLSAAHFAGLVVGIIAGAIVLLALALMILSGTLKHEGWKAIDWISAGCTSAISLMGLFMSKGIDRLVARDAGRAMGRLIETRAYRFFPLTLAS